MNDHEEVARLLPLARAGDAKALEALIERLRERVRGEARGQIGGRLRARLDASDVAQEVCMLACKAFPQFAGNTVPQLLAWFDEILRNVITNQRRHHGAAKRDAHRERPEGEVPFDPPADASTPSQRAIRNEEQTRLAEALRGLPEKQRLVFQLRYLQALPTKDAALTAGVTEENARVLLYRAIQRLKTELEEKP
jgi:RNA polymerase sigma-70 factor, ECF subfamily